MQAAEQLGQRRSRRVQQQEMQVREEWRWWCKSQGLTLSAHLVSDRCNCGR